MGVPICGGQAGDVGGGVGGVVCMMMMMIVLFKVRRLCPCSKSSDAGENRGMRLFVRGIAKCLDGTVLALVPSSPK